MMVGLRTQEDDRFVKFFKMIQEKAKQQDAVFFLDSEEGRGVWEDDIFYSDCSGWLIPFDKAEEFERDYMAFKDEECWEDWEDYAAWVTWEKSQSKLKIDIAYI